jgi:DNA-binding MarR family transcriptional regulator
MEPTTAAALKAMEELGYVERRQLPENRKNVYVHLSAKGRALRAKLEPLAVAVNKAAVRNVAAQDVAACRRTLLAVLENLKA